ncbi:MAG TPA: hypothetical protein VIJ59_09460 [Caulobacteraceae bacterium]
MKITTVAAIAAIGLAVGLSGCETATPYQPLRQGTAQSGGFTDQRLDQSHFRVSFQGNTLTSRATVENYLLYRAAELTVSSGYDWFETTDRQTDRDSQTYYDTLGPGPYGFWRPRWRAWGGWGGWGAWGPYWGDTGVVDTVQRFQASAEIEMQHGPKPAGNPRALDAREVLANLGPKIERPKS